MNKTLGVNPSIAPSIAQILLADFLASFRVSNKRFPHPNISVSEPNIDSLANVTLYFASSLLAMM
jgi:hypothetical protein